VALAQGLPWVLGLSAEALKHSTRCRLLMQTALRAAGTTI
jgi:hypothetical protein